jgi:2-hydroxy-3-keto-5-methylthiopentenyl-1-phosphate phosphatase
MTLPSLLSDYQKYLDIEKSPEMDSLDLQHIRFISPASFLPSIYLANSLEINPLNIQFHENTLEHGLKILGLSKGNSNMIPRMIAHIGGYDAIQKNKIITSFDTKIRELIFRNNTKGYIEYGNEETFRYVTGEMLSNVEQHSMADKIYSYSQLYPNEGYVEVGILDDGITIPGKYERSCPLFTDQEINPYDFKNDCDAINRCLNGISTKESFKRSLEFINNPSEIENNDNLGMGLNTSIRVITEGLGGSFLIASRGCICHITPKEKKFIKVNNNNIFRGTFVCVRFKKVELKTDEFLSIIEKFQRIDPDIT